MKKFKGFISSPNGTLAVFGAAVALLLFSSIGGARAALTYYSENHMTQIETQEIGVEILENGNPVPMNSAGTAKELRLIPADKEFQIGETYKEELSVRNTGEIDQYVRVTVYKSWVDANGDPVKDVFPGYIELTPANETEWWEDKDPSTQTQERTVFYYRKPLKSGEATEPFTAKLKINEDIGKIVTEDGDDVKFDYQGLKFQIKVDVDAVQTHNAADAILSSWGLEVGGSGADEYGAFDSLIFE